jgi:hypothetical protein
MYKNSTWQHLAIISSSSKFRPERSRSERPEIGDAGTVRFSVPIAGTGLASGPPRLEAELEIEPVARR